MTYYLPAEQMGAMCNLIDSVFDGSGPQKGVLSGSYQMPGEDVCDSEGLRTRWRVSVCYGRRECLLYATDRVKVGRKKTYQRFLGYASGAAIIGGVLRITLADAKARGVDIAEAERTVRCLDCRYCTVDYAGTGRPYLEKSGWCIHIHPPWVPGAPPEGRGFCPFFEPIEKAGA